MRLGNELILDDEEQKKGTSLMRTYEKLDELMGRILDLDARKVDLVSDTRHMSLTANEEVEMNVDTDSATETFALTPYAQQQLATDLKIPKRYFDRMREHAPHLLVQNVNNWLGQEPERRMLRGYRNGHIVGRAWLSDRYKRLDHVEIARRLLPEFENLGTEITFHQAAITDERLYLRAVLPQYERDIKVGDTVRWGVEIRNSEVGSGTFAISGFVLRLVCSNGMTVAESIKQRHVGRRILEEGILSDEALRADDTAFWLTARDVLRATISETRFEEVVAQLQATREGETIQKPIQATETLQQRFALSDDEREAVLTHLVAGGDLSRWGALSSVTRAAQDAPSFDRQAEMESMGWDIANLSEREWNRIAAA